MLYIKAHAAELLPLVLVLTLIGIALGLNVAFWTNYYNQFGL